MNAADLNILLLQNCLRTPTDYLQVFVQSGSNLRDRPKSAEYHNKSVRTLASLFLKHNTIKIVQFELSLTFSCICLAQAFNYGVLEKANEIR